MLQMLQFDERQRHTKLQENTYFQVLRLHNQLDEVNLLMRSLHLDQNGNTLGVRKAGTFEQIMELKALSIAFDSQNDNQPDELAEMENYAAIATKSLEMDKLNLLSENSETDSNTHRAAGRYEDASVWIEWRDIEGHVYYF